MSSLSTSRHRSRFAAPLLLFLFSVLTLGGLSACSGIRSGSGEGGDAEDSPYAGHAMEKPVAKPSFTLTNVADGRSWDFAAETEGYVTLLYFGYTHCPDVCPVQMTNLAAVLRDLPWETTSRIRVVFVTVDPARDTPERLRTWMSRFGDDFIGLRGTREQVNAIEKELGLPPSVVQPATDTSDYFVGHAAPLLAFGTDDTARVEYPYGTRQKDWWHDLQILVGAGDGAAPASRPTEAADRESGPSEPVKAVSVPAAAGGA